MLFSTSTLVSSLALLGLAASQVVVTVTNTVIVTTLTVTPKSTSTRTTYITVTGQAPAPVISSSTNYVTITVTSSGASTTVPATCPISEWGQCGGEGFAGNCAADPICGANAVCKYKDVWYSYCSNLPKIVHAVATVYV
ncbi:hypothetical protein L207DRAFT_574410 [Hyaloscypha variabilis F]|uniref:CBM1 domain-containing protein n=1 Tax=Hyaloscypha variabilis (strain UAMH 11265 / GT02V1 / F) TaxID=1149755 RepID=A0A2J6QS74_HYAVF|nr:hypothetical protein L207DRAFT_574410 [Hyaloscypha variabilis F]